MLLKNAKQSTKDIEAMDYIFCDVNCRLNIKFVDGRVRAFNSENEVASLISTLDESRSETTEVGSQCLFGGFSLLFELYFCILVEFCQ